MVRAVRTLRRQAPPAGIYASSYDPRLAAAICRRLAAGESLRAICRLDPAMPTEKTVWNWARAHPDFAAVKAHALAVARAAALAAQAQRDAARRAARAARVAAGGRRAWNAGLGFDPQAAEAILAALAGGRSLESACAERWAPCVGTVFNWLRERPDFLAQYRAVKVDPAEPLVERAGASTPWMGREAASYAELRRRVRAAERAGARLKLKRYAPYAGPAGVCWTFQDAAGGLSLLYGGAPAGAPEGADEGAG